MLEYFGCQSSRFDIEMATKLQNFDTWVSNQQQKLLLRSKQQHNVMDQGSTACGSMVTNNSILTDEMNEDIMVQRHHSMQQYGKLQRHLHQQRSERTRKSLPRPLSRTKPPLNKPTTINNVSTAESSSAASVHIVNSVHSQQQLSRQHTISKVDKHHGILKRNDTSNKYDKEPITKKDVASDNNRMAIVKLVQNTIHERNRRLSKASSLCSNSTYTTISSSSSSPVSVSTPPTTTPYSPPDQQIKQTAEYSSSMMSQQSHSPSSIVGSYIDDDSIFEFSTVQSKCNDNTMTMQQNKIREQNRYIISHDEQSKMKIGISSDSNDIPQPYSPTEVVEFDKQSEHGMSGRNTHLMMPLSHEYKKEESMQTSHDVLVAQMNEKHTKEIELLKHELSAVSSTNVTITHQMDGATNELYNVKTELKKAKDNLHRKESECSYLREENCLLKKECSESVHIAEVTANKIFERERQAHEEEVDALKKYIHKLEAPSAVVSLSPQDDTNVEQDGALIENLMKKLQEKDAKIANLLRDKEQTKIEHEQTLHTKQNEFDVQRIEYVTLQDEMSNMRSTHQIAQEELNIANCLLRKENEELAGESNEIKVQLDTVNGRLNTLQKQYDMLQSEYSFLEHSHSEKVNQMAVLNDSNEQLSTNLKQSVDTWKAEVVGLNESNMTLRRELNELRSEHEDDMIQHTLELSTVEGEHHNALVSVDELTDVNRQLKDDNESLHRQVSCLEEENDKMEAGLHAEMTEHNKTKSELSAWKLEMLNALNDIDLLKKERDELKTKVESSITGKFLCY